MKVSRKFKMMFLFSMLSADLIALFWAIWELVAGRVPEMNAIKFTGTITLVLPFSISRWWDILIGPVWACVLVYLLTSKRIKMTTKDSIGFGLGFGLIFGLIFAFGASLNAGIAFALVFALGAGIAFAMSFGQPFALGIVLGVALDFALIYGLLIGVGVGLAFGLGR